MVYLINYADATYRAAQKWNSRSASFFNIFDKIYEFGPNDIDQDFSEKYKHILSIKRGNGCWLWKSYFINRIIQKSQNGDIIFYVDSGACFIRNPKILFDYIDNNNPLFVTDIPLIESCWTKPECFDIMDAHQYKDCNQIQATYFLFVVNNFTRLFFQEYFSLCKDTEMIIPSGLGKKDVVKKNYGRCFVSHREDQSIFSLLCHKYGIKAHRDISQRGFKPNSYYNPNYAYRVPEHPNDKYPTIVYLHKERSLVRFILKRIYTILQLGKLKKFLDRK